MGYDSVRSRISLLRPKYLLFAFIGLMVVYVLGHSERFQINAKDPIWQHYQPFRWWLLPHALGGACALLLAPMQFSDRLRKRFTKLHRVVGRFYVAGVLIGTPLGTYIQYYEERMGVPAHSVSPRALTPVCGYSQRPSPCFSFFREKSNCTGNGWCVALRLPWFFWKYTWLAV